jgi:hypothetical protein
VGPWGGFCLGLVVAVLVNFLTALFSRERGLKLIPWLLFYVSLHLSAVFLNTDFMRGKVMEMAHNGNHGWPSYAFVMLVTACLAGFYWHGINLGIDKLAAATQEKPVDSKPEEGKSKEEDKKDAPRSAQKKDDKHKTPPQIKQESHGDNSPNVATFGDNSPATVTINPEKSPYAPTYDFNGARRTIQSGIASVGVGEEWTVFQKLVQLEKTKDWKELHDTCEDQIKKTPEWLTPYLFSGVAYVNLGERAKGIERLEYVKKKAGGNPDYAAADRLLNQLQPKN